MSAVKHHPTCTPDYPEKNIRNEAAQALTVIEFEDGTVHLVCVDCGASAAYKPVNDDLTTLQEVPDYRFGTLVKGEQFAYARGLTINPTHLPAALDAMAKDGWQLLAIFGETNSANVGFVFKREGF